MEAKAVDEIEETRKEVRKAAKIWKSRATLSLCS